jgi:hypothetical protein
VQPPRELLLVVSVDLRPFLRQQPPQTDCRRRLAVRKMMDDFARRPLVRRRPCIELFRRDLQQRLGDRRVAVLVLGDQLFPFFRVHTHHVPRHAEV